MLTYRHFALGLFSSVVLTSCATGTGDAQMPDGGGAPAVGPLSDETVAAVIDVAEAHVGNAPGGLAIAIEVPGSAPLIAAVGNAREGEPATAQTVFEIGSVTKEFTAALILRASTEGRLSLDDELSDHLADYPAPRPITLRHLLSHTSGITSYTSVAGFGADPQREYTHADILALFSSLPLQFEPGSAWAYSNSGYYLLGLVLEEVYGQTYAEILNAQLLAPLGLDQTGYCDTDAVTQPRAQGFTDGEANASIQMTQPFAAGAMCSTAGDILAWHTALTNGDVTTVAFDSPEVVADALRTPYGLGVFVGRNHWRPYVGHGGNINGFTARATFDVDSGITVVLLSNRNGDDLVAVETALMNILVDTRHEDRTYEVTAEDRTRRVGTYARLGLPTIEIEDGPDGLVGVFGSSPDLVLTPVGPNDFSVDAADLRIRFVDGPSPLLEVEQFGILLTLLKQPEAP